MNKYPLQSKLSYNPRIGLCDAILARINLEKVRRAHKQFVGLVLGTIISLCVFVYTIVYTIVQFTQSAFPQYFSLILSDGNGIFGYWRELSYALVESLPIVSIALVCVTCGILLFLTQNIIKNYSISHPAYS